MVHEVARVDSSKTSQVFYLTFITVNQNFQIEPEVTTKVGEPTHTIRRRKTRGEGEHRLLGQQWNGNGKGHRIRLLNS